MTQAIAAAVLALVLVACGNLPQPFSKEAPLAPKDALVAPPWQAMVKAGPGASRELDLETLNGPQSSPVEPVTQEPGAPEPPAAVEAKASKPAQTIRAVAVLPVTGDAASGSAELTKAMKMTLQKAGWPVRDKGGKDALTVAGKVKLGEARGSMQTVTLAWEVLSPDGGSLGLVSQTNDVPAGSLDRGWGDQAVPAVEAAATGIFQLIDKFR